MTLFECVPNISEGRNLEAVRKIANAVRAVNEVELLDYSSDADHHRSVLTFIGTTEGIQAGALACAQEAIQSLDLNDHVGVHPRIGVIDVIPFIPLDKSHILQAWEIAHAVGQQIELGFNVPVYYYRGDEILVPAFMEHFNPLPLPDIRKRAQSLPARRHATAGAVAVGVRDFLVAYNIILETNDLNIAKQMAFDIRTAQSGLPGVRALGLALPQKGHVQVSMNLTQPLLTTRNIIREKIGIMARSLNIEVAGEEIIGLFPEQVQGVARSTRWE